MHEELKRQMREDFDAFKQRNNVTGGDSLLWRMWSDGYVAAWNRRAHASAGVAEGVAIAADAFALGWNSALSDAAFYVVGHCGDGDHHAETILEMRAPIFKFRGEAVSIPAQGIDHAKLDERAAFEAWAKEWPLKWDDSTNGFENSNTHDAWQAWQARGQQAVGKP